MHVAERGGMTFVSLPTAPYKSVLVCIPPYLLFVGAILWNIRKDP